MPDEGMWQVSLGLKGDRKGSQGAKSPVHDIRCILTGVKLDKIQVFI